MIKKCRIMEILLVDDSPTDVLMVEEAYQSSGLPHRLHVVDNGVQALEFLHRTKAHAAAPRPDLILLDLNLPRKDGRELLEELKSNESLRSIPVVVLTTSKAEEDISRAYDLHANCYITKPLDFEHFGEVVKSVNQFWFSTVTLPQP